ncbi:BioY protein [Roseomonas frigidaquae]|uniref:Biotin transporter n=1 Tax=Falsiroseomonas frigidaquae TaxID=487318 RepID=A0ABX1EU97_9PROT|nr:biotin transporter BioY [Falsiroseomonas frigidaquae]NKE44201.1 BioY protein [Falsiroseomonas frigidaquae]
MTQTLPATTARSRALAAGRFAGMALLGSWLLAASAQISLPMWPVPATLQSLVVLLLGALGGPAAGLAAVAAYLAQGVAGLPVFANGAAGPAALVGPTGGYLLGFALAAWLAGFARGQDFARQAVLLLAAHLLLFVPGVAWLAAYVGPARAFEAGFLLFVPGTVVKTALALALLRALARR